METRRLMDALMNGQIKTVEDMKDWVQAHP
jgi:hypothetical protein